jgi:hypothetical protein
MATSAVVVEAALGRKNGEVAVIQMHKKPGPEDSIRDDPGAVIASSPASRFPHHVAVRRSWKVRAGPQGAPASPMNQAVDVLDREELDMTSGIVGPAAPSHGSSEEAPEPAHARPLDRDLDDHELRCTK